MNSTYHALYSLITACIALPLSCFAVIFLLLHPQHRKGLPQRLGVMPSSAKTHDCRPKIWIHAASVGEVGVAESIIQAVASHLDCNVVLSTYTWDGLEHARKRFNGRINTVLFPLDIGFCTQRALKAIRPDLYVAIETELWPNFLITARRMRIKTMLANGRLSPKSLRRFSLVRPFMKSILGCLDLIAMAGRRQADRMALLGASKDQLRVCPNAKYGILVNRAVQGAEKKEQLGRLLSLSEGGLVFVAGSIRSGEETIVVRACRKLLEAHNDMICIIAPRHMKRVASLEIEIRRAGMDCRRWSDIRNGSRKRTSPIVVVDTIGELFYLYGLGTVVFCGGSLIDKGGQNVMEPAAWGIGPLYGPYMEDFLDAAEALEANTASMRVNDGNELIEKLLWLIDNPDERIERGLRAFQVAEYHAGAAEKTASLIKDLLSPGDIKHETRLANAHKHGNMNTLG